MAYSDSYRSGTRAVSYAQSPLGSTLVTLEAELHGITTVFYAVLPRGSSGWAKWRLCIWDRSGPTSLNVFHVFSSARTTVACVVYAGSGRLLYVWLHVRVITCTCDYTLYCIRWLSHAVYVVVLSLHRQWIKLAHLHYKVYICKILHWIRLLSSEIINIEHSNKFHIIPPENFIRKWNKWSNSLPCYLEYCYFELVFEL